MTAAPLPDPPQNLEAEEYVLGAMMLAESAIERILATGLEAPDFYRESHGKIYRAAISLHQLGKPVDPITVSERLEELQQLADAGGKERVRDIASIVPTVTNAAFHAEIVIREARRRNLQIVGQTLILRAQESVDPDEIHTEAEQLLERESTRSVAADALTGMSHAEVLALELPEQRYLVDDLIPAGAAGTIAAVPESHKSWLAQAIAVRVAAGQGWILGRKITMQGPVGYLWQDDSTREEAERVKAFEAAHAQPTDLPITWYLNPGVTFPRDFARLRATIQERRLVLVVLDSLYNFLPGIDLKDDLPEKIIAQLKTEICDPTGCSVLVVDHMPWATEQNRSRLRAYGGVFKNAATRFGIYIDIVNDKIHVEARGNNITGFKSIAYWDKTDLELKLAPGELDEEDLKAPADDLLDWINENGGEATTTEIRLAFGIDVKTLRARHESLEKLNVEIIEKRGKATLYIARDPSDEQLAISDADTTDQNDADLDPGSGTLGVAPWDSQGQGLPGSETAPPQGKRDTLGMLETDSQGRLPGSENGLDTGETTLGDPSTPTEYAYARARETHSESNGHHPDEDLDLTPATADPDADLI